VEALAINHGSYFLLQHLYSRYGNVRYDGFHPDPPGGGIATAPAALGRIRAALTRVLSVCTGVLDREMRFTIRLAVKSFM
jgi:hypothetical protein